jgi:DNA-binding NarL/FixJ family response regulator
MNVWADMSRATGTELGTVLVVDDHRAFADAMAMVINAQPDLRCVGVAASAEEGLRYVEAQRPSVVLLDIKLPGLSGIDALTMIKRDHPKIRVLLITGGDTTDILLWAAEAGADGLLRKEDALSLVIDAVRNPDEAVVTDPGTLEFLRRRATNIAQARAGGEHVGLTERELEVLRLLGDGIPVKSIARRLGISINTCRGYVQAVLQKLAAHSQLDAVVKAAKLGLLPNFRG